ncbi:hypothetical protein T440DRAFT_466383 [Plenodomus tracheiphilus IPT5]|uniref:Uncharacterized protein n=1 Tax=Plenodomus tracheiphilus IPT5 TaxID=1408161 RepID=A0A6A7BDL9_9PLEO|nr:hypothetical protein T440DRAFT_466383 [Plenodomus tracheiphilus IPT5]
MPQIPPLQKDPYIVAYRYWEYVAKNPGRPRELCNQYYERLLANQQDPKAEATDDKSRAIRYAKAHYECYYELRDISRIIRWLDILNKS